MGIKQWKLPEHAPDEIQRLQKETGLPELLCAILVARGIDTKHDFDAFFSDAGELDDPFLLKDMDHAVERVQQAIEDGERIAVYGDYDCDGVTSTALLTSYLQSVGADVIYYVPSREKEGYGLNCAAVDMLAGQRVDLIITVDNGISAHAEVAHAASLGIDVVITDHHTPRDTLPEAVAVVNPHRADCPSRFKGLAGVGVAFKLICALEGASGSELLEYYSDIVALGTIADVVPLVGENRIIVRHGVARLCETENPGLAALLAVSGQAGRELTGEAVAFGIIPRINASGRVGCVDEAIELLLTDDVTYAEETAALINQQNEERKKIEEKILLEIDGILAQNPQILNQRVLIVSGKGWHHGVVGIVCAKLVERYSKPCLVFSIDGGEARGSGRGVQGFSFIEAIAACSEHLTRYGGHTLAAGLTMPTTALVAFTLDLQNWTGKRYAVMPVPMYTVDCVLEPAWLTVESIAQLSRLEPFGSANEVPLFLLAGLKIDGIYPTNDKKHIRIRFSAQGNQFYAVYFRMSEQSFPYAAGDVVDALANVSVGQYNGKPQLSVKLRDVRPAGVGQEHQQQILLGNERYACYLREEAPDDWGVLIPDRGDLAVVYKYIKKCGTYLYGSEELYYRLMDSGLDYGKMLVSLDIMEDLGLIRRGSGSRAISLLPTDKKVDIEQSRIMVKLRA